MTHLYPRYGRAAGGELFEFQTASAHGRRDVFYWRRLTADGAPSIEFDGPFRNYLDAVIAASHSLGMSGAGADIQPVAAVPVPKDHNHGR